MKSYLMDRAIQKTNRFEKHLRVSVVIPTYNRAHLICRAVDSALAQCLNGDEVIVVDDGSTDNTEAALAPYGSRIVYLRVPNGGAGRARNVGVRSARNPLIAFLDSDDEWMPGKLEVQRTLMQARGDIVFCFTDTCYRVSSGREIRRLLSFRYNDPNIGEHILNPGVLFSSLAPITAGRDDFLVHIGNLYPAEMGSDHICTSSLVVSRDEAGDALWFAEDLPTFEDWECNGRLARKGPAAYLDCETTWTYRHEGPQLTNASSLANATARVAVLTRVWGQDPTYLSEHENSYNQVLRQQRLTRTRELLALARLREAREELSKFHGAPVYYHILANLPASIVRFSLYLRRFLKSILPVQT